MLMNVFDGILIVLAVLVLVPSFIFCLECLAALLPQPAGPDSEPVRPRLAILVPAHNEEANIAITLKTLLAQVQPQDRTIVIADNCTDRTAEVARSFAGVTVIERWNDKLRGKGYALDFGVQFLDADPPEVVVAVDSDCSVGAGAVEALATAAAAQQRPVQSRYLMQRPASRKGIAYISALALIIKNLVRPLGLKRLGFPCVLTGSGMAFPWSIIRQAPLASGKTVDDMQLTIDLSLRGYSPAYCPAARVTGRLMDGQAAQSQRRRWEHGHLEVLLQEVPLLLKAAWTQKRFDLLALALDLSVPPMSLLALGWAGLATVAAAACLVGFSPLPLACLCLSGLAIGTAIFSAWARFAAIDIPLANLLTAPLYILWKVPIYLAFLVKPQTQWVTTERD